MKKNDLFTVTIEDMSEDGAGIGKTDGYTWFVKDGVIGDVVEAGVTKMKKNYGFARLVRIITPSPFRIVPRCPVARQCGGCQLQAMSYEEQLRFKERKIRSNLSRLGGIPEDQIPMEPIMGMEDPWRYRNKAQFPFGRTKDGEIVTGFYAGRTHSIIPQEDCLLGIEENKDILEIIKNFMKEYKIEPYDEAEHRGLVRHALIRKGFATGQLRVCLVINGKKLPRAEVLTERLLAVPGMTSISYSVNEERTNVILGREVIHLHGPGYITDRIGEVSYRISPLSFYQVNPFRRGSSTRQPWNLPVWRGARPCGTCTAASEPFPCSWPRRRRRSAAWRSCPGHPGRQGERPPKRHGERGVLRGEGGGGAAGTVREEPHTGGCDRGGSPPEGLRRALPGDHREDAAEAPGVRQLRLRHPGAGCEIPAGARL